ncbi:response regulator [Sphingomonas hengshuiensis]|uniref:Transcriptional regulator n=1 Tax=Sphingomonas hengshuiensis TaxID=1609977 RepID=A0A7U4J895_9SPHN|nr:response regulator [Sphingomonas hengshuiensis]AJP72092.1 transcriptional regulator [Sphingomonas hengshuiensis]
MSKVLVVDDDISIRTLLANSLSAHGYDVCTAANTIEMNQALVRTPVDLIILDVMMPGEDGLSACRRLVDDGGPPVVLFSALGEEQDRIAGLEFGADYYLTKTCTPREVLANVRAVLRRQERPVTRPERYSFGEWTIDLSSNELLDGHATLIDLTDGEFAVLRAFVQHPRRVLSRDALLELSRGRDSEAFGRAIDIQVSRLRRKLRAPGDDVIRTVKHEGYLFSPQVQRA